jgi:phage-related protein
LTASSRVNEIEAVRDWLEARAVKSVRTRNPSRTVRVGIATAELAARRREKTVNFMLDIACV